jgi:hypothetical protein
LSVVEVKDVVKNVPGSGVIAHSIDCPRPGDSSDEYVVEVGGWVVAGPVPAVSVEVLVSGVFVTSIPVNLVRPDVAELHAAAAHVPTGYSARVAVLGLPARCRLDLKLVLEDESRLHLGRALVEHSVSAADVECRFLPLMLTSLGRTGTTWLMRLLSEHPGIVAHRSYPYESMMARYWAHQLRVLSAPADILLSCSPDSFAADLWRVGHNPFYGDLTLGAPHIQRWLGRTYVDRLVAFTRESIEGFYAMLASQQGQCDEGYFAEKSLPDHLPWILWDLYPRAREIILVRDIRDVLCSMMSFNAKRGTASFGREDAGDDLEFVDLLARDFRLLHVAWKERESRVKLVRYEDLVLDPVRTLLGILEYLDLDTRRAVVEEMISGARVLTDDLTGHRTSPSPSASIGRWRNDLDPALASACENSMSDLLSEFGYFERAA